MNVVIEVEAATCESEMATPRALTVRKWVGEVASSIRGLPSTSITRFLSMGSTSLSAVSPDNYSIEVGLAVA
jgi:hypothetical protein